jgi:hypothetical protein
VIKIKIINNSVRGIILWFLVDKNKGGVVIIQKKEKKKLKKLS